MGKCLPFKFDRRHSLNSRHMIQITDMSIILIPPVHTCLKLFQKNKKVITTDLQKIKTLKVFVLFDSTFSKYRKRLANK